MKLEYFQVNSFCNSAFGGNPAAVIPLQQWLDDALLQQIAHEINLSETAFFVPEGEGFQLRWFTPMTEVDLCGHATLAAAFVLHQQAPSTQYCFYTRSGELQVTPNANGFCLEMPSQQAQSIALPEVLRKGLNTDGIIACHHTDDYIIELASQQQVEELTPDFEWVSAIDLRGTIVTAPGDQCDFVSRFFGSRALGIIEDPVTGSAHASLTPYWAQRLRKSQLTAQQLSVRGGTLHCRWLEESQRSQVTGQAFLLLQGQLYI